jgi:hypothetical protein
MIRIHSHKLFMRVALILCLVFFSGIASFAIVINVPGEHPTIQGAINAATDGDTVLVSHGTYYENINFGGKNITVRGMALMAPSTIIHGAASPPL